ncbi:hypothetical protein EYZ11_009518 [Aspergillus tanneri]|uniref:Uncharacterized protein n=1 Tax=Aspergillus tanneri TaxID=1220188 RepID=A0A4S3J7W3_9EURO|nr:hypothetical protein EYZ11_009518 [Aspergillus tanneri]
MFRQMKDRVAELENAVGRISDSLFRFHEMAIQSDLHITHPDLFQQINNTLAHIQMESKELGIQSTNHQSPALRTNDSGPSFGYLIHRDQQIDTNKSISSVPRSLAIGTLSLHETIFSRRLHRYCLEYAWRLFIDARSNPQDVYRVFRLVPCIRYKDKMTPYFRCLVRGGAHESLDLPAVPFYCIGGAGTHYPRKKDDGTPIYPENMRLPRRILGLSSSTSGDAHDEREEKLKSLGLHGTWLDCHDVQGYLEERGLVLELSGARMDVHGPDGQSRLTLHVEEFFRCRAPGFRLDDVECAFQETARMSGPA